MIPAGYRTFNSEHVPGKTKLLEFIYGLRRYTFSVTNQAALLLERYMPNKLLLIFETIFCYLDGSIGIEISTLPINVVSIGII